MQGLGAEQFHRRGPWYLQDLGPLHSVAMLLSCPRCSSGYLSDAQATVATSPEDTSSKLLWLPGSTASTGRPSPGCLHLDFKGQDQHRWWDPSRELSQGLATQSSGDRAARSCGQRSLGVQAVPAKLQRQDGSPTGSRRQDPWPNVLESRTSAQAHPEGETPCPSGPGGQNIKPKIILEP